MWNRVMNSGLDLLVHPNVCRAQLLLVSRCPTMFSMQDKWRRLELELYIKTPLMSILPQCSTHFGTTSVLVPITHEAHLYFHHRCSDLLIERVCAHDDRIQCLPVHNLVSLYIGQITI